MKTLIAFIGILLISSPLYGQNYKSLSVQIWPESDTLQKSYTLTGFRHGVSFFPKVNYPQVQYEAGESLTFDRYHAANVIYTWLERWAAKYPNLVDLYEVGKSYEGRPIIQITITNKKTGKDTDKPAAYFEGGRHSVEVTGSECVLYFAKYLIEKYGEDPSITHLIDTKTIYLRPINNPDGHNLYMNTAQLNRSTVRPMDEDGDGLLDEDPPDDINGDGNILIMRWKDKNRGDYIIDQRDPLGRIMKQVPAGQGIYLSEWEGIDNDGDGKINEDLIGGPDLNCNYPENWRPESETTGRGYIRWGAGDYPLSETETRAVVTFLLSHPNVFVVNSMDTSFPMHVRPPSTSPSSERMYPEDLSWYKLFDEIGKKITGYAKAGDAFNDLAGGYPLFGHGADFGYWYFGAIWYCDELWDGGYKDYNGDGTIDEIDMIKWDDDENDSMGFYSWKPAKHPVYGDIEIGGFDMKFGGAGANPPPKHLEPWIKNEALFNLEMAKSLPELVWENIDVKKIKSYKTDSTDYQLTVSYKNIGKLPTALKQAHLVKIVKDDKVVVNFDSTNISGDIPEFKVLPEEMSSTERGREGYSIQGKSVTKIVVDTQGGETTSVLFKLRTYKGKELTGKAIVLSTRGGVLKNKEFSIK
jgi:hypothetical protein